MPRAYDTQVIQVIETLKQGVVDDSELRDLVERAAQPMLILDAQAAILAANQRAEALLDIDRSSLQGRPFALLVHPAERVRLRELVEGALATGIAPDDVDARFEGAAGITTITFFPVRSEKRMRLALLIRDAPGGEGATRIARLERDLQASELRSTARLESIERNRKLTDLGELMSRVAHELRSPATYIENLSVLADVRLRRLAASHPEVATEIDRIREDNVHVREGALRIGRLLADLQPLTRNRPTRRVAVDLADVVRNAVRTFQGSVPGKTRVELDLHATHPVELDLDEIVRVLVNLLRNASEAMDGEGRIVVSTWNQDRPPQIRVEDDGPGVASDVEPRLFEPFFTTKREGTGLGLAISRGIVEMNGGTLRYERAPGGGAAFVLEFPWVVDRR